MNETVPPPWDVDGAIERPVSRQARRMADEIFAKIAAGQFEFGTRLPAEREFAEEYLVSRATVRQALSLLQRHGLIERRPGSGSIVRYLAPRAAEPADGAVLGLADLAATTSPLEYGVVRSIVEPEIVRLAVLNMTSRNIERMKQIRAEMDAVTVDGEAFARIDDRLRMHLAECCRNPLLLAMWQLVKHVGAGADWAVGRRRALTPGRIRTHANRIRALCAAIENRDLEASVEHARLMLADFNQDLVPGA
jgi:DNA-binding FadR family transcriptional regulator